MKFTRIGKAITLMSMAILLVSLLVVGSSCGEAREYRIGIAQLLDHPALNANREGFIAALASEGFIEGENVRYDYRDANNEGSLINSIAQTFAQGDYDLILAIGTPMAQACAQATNNTGIPVVFGSVTDPVEAGLIDSWEHPGGNVTGISDWADIRTQLELVKEIVPGCKRLGVIYNPGEVNSVIQVDEVKALAPELGIESVVEAPVANSNEVLTAAQSLVGRVDAIWVPTDNTVVGSFESAVGVCEDNDIPIFAADVATVERGAVASIGIDYYQLGLECGHVAALILNGEDPANIPAKKVEMTDLWINPAAAERMGVEIPSTVLERATNVVAE